MKVILEGKAQSKPEVIGLITEDALLNPSQINVNLNKMNLKIEKIETVNGEKVVHVVETKSNLLCG